MLQDRLDVSDEAAVFSLEQDIEIPDGFECPITCELMVDPVITAHGRTYERKAITAWFNQGKFHDPMSGAKLPHRHLVPNLDLKKAIDRFVKARPALERRTQEVADLVLALQLRENELKAALEKKGLFLEAVEKNRLHGEVASMKEVKEEVKREVKEEIKEEVKKESREASLENKKNHYEKINQIVSPMQEIDKNIQVPEEARTLEANFVEIEMAEMKGDSVSEAKIGEINIIIDENVSPEDKEENNNKTKPREEKIGKFIADFNKYSKEENKDAGVEIHEVKARKDPPGPMSMMDADQPEQNESEDDESEDYKLAVALTEIEAGEVGEVKNDRAKSPEAKVRRADDPAPPRREFYYLPIPGEPGGPLYRPPPPTFFSRAGRAARTAALTCLECASEHPKTTACCVLLCCGTIFGDSRDQ